jgi:hypothetical protein
MPVPLRCAQRQAKLQRFLALGVPATIAQRPPYLFFTGRLGLIFRDLLLYDMVHDRLLLFRRFLWNEHP